jgi:UDP-glucose 4-epimerase
VIDVLVTGGRGYIGSRLVDRLQRTHPDWAVTVLDNLYLGDVREVGDVSAEHVDVRDRDRQEGTLAVADVLCHLTAISGVNDCEEQADLAYEVNVRGTENVA